MVVGARPNFMKLAPLYFELKKKKLFLPIILHTGQHYDFLMSEAFFKDLKLPKPDYFLGVKASTQIEQIAKIATSFEKVLLKEKPDLVVVFGDVNSTFACGFVAKRLGIPLAHVEAGLRSFDETMPEEINRKLTDSLAELLFTTSRDDNNQLLREGVPQERIHLVGDIMIDSLVKVLKVLDSSREKKVLSRYGVASNAYGLVTLHRPSNVDTPARLKSIMTTLAQISLKIPIVFPVHPRTKKKLKAGSVKTRRLVLIDPVNYSDFIALEKNARFLLTDSGSIQTETTYLGIPCLTLRPNTERPLTIRQGTNQLVDLANLKEKVAEILKKKAVSPKTIPYWDGKTAGRIGRLLEQWFKENERK